MEPSFMKLLISFFLFSFLFSSYAYYEDNADVLRLVRAGETEVIRNSQKCPKLYGPKNEKDLLKGQDHALCIDILELPEEVTFEVMQMKEAELENESDYDQRVTSLLSFRWQKLSHQSFSLKSIKELSRALNIPEGHISDLHVEAELVGNKSFSMFDNLFVGLEFFDRSHVQSYLLKEFKGELVQIVSFGDGVSLYPGGGFYVTHYLIIGKEKVSYVKLSWWNS